MLSIHFLLQFWYLLSPAASSGGLNFIRTGKWNGIIEKWYDFLGSVIAVKSTWIQREGHQCMFAELQERFLHVNLQKIRISCNNLFFLKSNRNVQKLSCQIEARPIFCFFKKKVNHSNVYEDSQEDFSFLFVEDFVKYSEHKLESPYH